MTKSRLTPKQKVFVDCTLLVHRYRTITDAYIAVYEPKGTRRSATAAASRVYNMPAVKLYRKELREISAQRAVDEQEKENRLFLKRLRGY